MTGETVDPWAPNYAPVAARLLHDVSKELTTEEVAVECGERGVTLRSGVASYRMVAMELDEEDLKFPKDANEAVVSVKAGQLTSLFASVCRGVNGTDPGPSVVLAVDRDHLVCQAMAGTTLSVP